MCATFSRQQYSIVGNSNPSRQPHLAVSKYEAYHNSNAEIASSTPSAFALIPARQDFVLDISNLLHLVHTNANLIFDRYIPRGTHPKLDAIDGAIAPVDVSDAGGESAID